jgi:HSP20 family protein
MSYIIHRPAFRTSDPFARLFDSVFAHPSATRSSRNQAESVSSPAPSWRPRADISETDTSYIVRADIPDTPRENVSITLEDNILTVSGTRKTSEEHSEERTLRVERFSGEFQRRFTLPEDADEEGIAAAFDSGVLTITIPRQVPVEAPGKRTIAIA